jgi:hypothetical protein
MFSAFRKPSGTEYIISALKREYQDTYVTEQGNTMKTRRHEEQNIA